jgi:hypothetical protein
MATTFKPVYASGAAVTITLASLAESNDWTAGRQSSEIDNTTNLYDDLLVSGKITTGTTPTVSTQINIYVAAWDAQANAYPDTITGAGDAAKTITSANVLAAGLKVLKTILIDSTSNRTYYFSNEPVAALFGGNLPQKIVIFVSQNTDANLHATGGNHAVDIQGVQWQGV